MKEVLGDRRWGRDGQLAFAYGIGMPYRRVEFTARKPVDPWWIQRRLVPYDQNEVREDIEKAVAEIQAWLAVPATPEFAAKQKAARDAFMVGKAARRERILADRARSVAAE